jgi:hypothetical protein
MQEQVFFTQAELSRRWRLSPRTLEGWRLTGMGPAFVRVGSRVIYPVDSVRRFEAAGWMLGVANRG